MFGGQKFNPDVDIPDLFGKVILITGGNHGLGQETALQLAKHNPSAIYITSRSITKGQETIAKIQALVPEARIHLLELDLASLSSVQNVAKQFLASSARLDILMNNAGIMAIPHDVTKDGYEIQFGTNHLGHALLTKLLLPTLLATAKLPGADVRIVTLSSTAHALSTPKGGIAFPLLHTAQEEDSRVAKYGQSKLANILHAKELARRYPEIKCVAVHPGTASTGLSKNLQDRWVFRALDVVVGAAIGVSVAEAAWTQLWAATSEQVTSGTYYVPVGKKSAGSVFSRDAGLAGRLWDWTEKELEGHVGNPSQMI